ncbi:unnamed protein product [Soboliphyme baturini]|uniref:Uncharacterized protein n=1 Tax=Soboliphyme baturini TaxID=241478 RepID=A0A183IYT2_9BILA|nr:unnamed protein product [Soboliphyme baturini]
MSRLVWPDIASHRGEKVILPRKNKAKSGLQVHSNFWTRSERNYRNVHFLLVNSRTLKKAGKDGGSVSESKVGFDILSCFSERARSFDRAIIMSPHPVDTEGDCQAVAHQRAIVRTNARQAASKLFCHDSTLVRSPSSSSSSCPSSPLAAAAAATAAVAPASSSNRLSNPKGGEPSCGVDVTTALTSSSRPRSSRQLTSSRNLRCDPSVLPSAAASAVMALMKAFSFIEWMRHVSGQGKLGRRPACVVAVFRRLPLAVVHHAVHHGEYSLGLNS